MTAVSRPRTAAALLFALIVCAAPGGAQVDPERRRLLHLGLDRPMSGSGPAGAYVFFYSNEPQFLRKNMNLRMVLAPVYIDGELGFTKVARQTDGALGVAGGGFVESYNEVRAGHYHKDESFDGHTLAANGSLYPRLSPDSWRIPLNMVLRIGAHASWYGSRSDTAANFGLPKDHIDWRFRAGLRLGGAPPDLSPARAAEISLWYQGYLRDRHGTYGFSGDRRMEQHTHLFWSRAMISFKQDSGKQFRAAIEAGGSSTPDRLNAYRLGGQLPFASEFPLSLPGYFNGELTARRYALIGGDYMVPLDRARLWAARVFVNAANVSYLQGLGQPRPWNESVGTGFDYMSRGGALRVELKYGYGINALRGDGRGAHTASILTQIDFIAWRRKVAVEPQPGPAPERSEGLYWLMKMFKP